MELGFNRDVSNELYHGDREYVSSSGLKLLYTDPKAYYDQYVLNLPGPKINTANLDFGSYLHSRILEPEKTGHEFAIFNGASKKGKEWEEFSAANEGRTILTSSQKEVVDKLISKFEEERIYFLGEDCLVSSLFKGGAAEETLCVDMNSVKVKVRFDYRKLNDKYAFVNDLKTSSEYVNTLDQVAVVCRRYHYDISAALYVDAAYIETGVKHDFYFTFLSKKDFGVQVYKASDQMLKLGRYKYNKALETLKLARTTGEYFTKHVEEITL